MMCIIEDPNSLGTTVGLDKAYAKSPWLSKFLNAILIHKQIVISDHCLVLFQTKNDQEGKTGNFKIPLWSLNMEECNLNA